MRISDYIAEKARKYGQNKYIKTLLRPFYTFGYKRIVDNYSKKKRQKLIHQYGIEALSLFDKCMTENGYNYSLAFGSCLGAVREHGFIKHDLDIDTWMWYEDFDEKIYDQLAEYGIKRLYNYRIGNGEIGMLDTFVYHGFHIDIFYIYNNISGREYPYCCDFPCFKDCATMRQSVLLHGGMLPRRIEMPYSKNVERVRFETLTLPIFTTAHDILRQRYGKSYMTPNPYWTNSEKNDYIVEWAEYVGTFTEYK